MLITLLGKKSAYVMTAEYRQIIAATPHVKRKTSLTVKVLLLILIGIIASHYYRR